MEIRSFRTESASHALLADIRHLMNRSFEGDFDDSDWEHALGGVHVVAFDGSRLVAHGSVVGRTLAVDGGLVHTGYVEAVATDPDDQGAGWGTRVMTRLSDRIRSDYAMGALGTGAYRFYERLGWRRWNGPTGVRRGSSVVRTPEDDDAIMVLLFGATAEIDTTAMITCDDRVGDVW